jgi:hypothetical protein
MALFEGVRSPGQVLLLLPEDSLLLLLDGRELAFKFGGLLLKEPLVVLLCLALAGFLGKVHMLREDFHGGCTQCSPAEAGCGLSRVSSRTEDGPPADLDGEL